MLLSHTKVWLKIARFSFCCFSKMSVWWVVALLFQAEGYTDGDLTLFHSFTVTAFLKAENPVDFLAKASEVRSLHRGLCYLANRTAGHFWSNLRIKLVFLNWTLFCLVQIILDNKDLECHATTTNEIKECCRDIRVLGRKELRLVVWNIRKKIGFVVGPKYFDRTYNRYRGIEFFSFICRLLLSWRSKLRRYLSKKLKMEAKSLQDEIK